MSEIAEAGPAVHGQGTDQKRPAGDNRGGASGRWASVVHWVKSDVRLHGIALLALAAVALGLAIGWAVHVNSVKSQAEQRVAELRQQAEQAREAAAARGKAALTKQATSLLRLSGLPLGWALRDALMADRLRDADTYLARIVREENVTRAALVGADGRVRLASDRKLQGKTGEEAFPGAPLSASEPTVREAAGGEVLVVVPVMGLDRRLGTLIYGYAPPSEGAPSQ